MQLMKIISFSLGIVLCQMLSGQSSIRPIAVGKLMPDIRFDYIWRGSEGQGTLADFKGKLIIFNFWSTSCGPCVEELSKIKQLQKRFFDKVQFIGVTSEPKKVFLKWFAKNSDKLPDCPNICEDTLLSLLFPHFYLGHKVMVDLLGVVRVSGLHENLTNGKIQSILDGEPVTFVKNSERFTGKKTIASMVDSLSLKVGALSLFTRFSDDIGGFNPDNSFQDVRDSFSRTVRSDYINASIVDLYETAWSPQLQEAWSKAIFNQIDPVILNLADSFKYTGFALPYLEIDDAWLRNNLYCYEQILPIAHSYVKFEFMKHDLDHYFGSLYGTFAQLESRKTFCYKIIRRSCYDKIKTKGGLELYFKANANNVKSIFQNADLKMTLRNMCYAVFQNEKTLVLDETQYTGKVDMSFPRELKTLFDFKRALLRYDLDIIQSEATMPFLVLSEQKHKTLN